ncbi:acyl-CoA dehydrogenase [Pseudonocardia sp. TMWB2A]|uniref:acyl-CoA dehydrogenase n=1 Tax=Pseudonocardia sp. TMWB2A TaxID=687430 RepID=UPI00307D4A97
MTYTPPVSEQRFLLDHIVKIDELASHARFADATPDMVDAILTGIGEFAAEEYAPTNRVGDTHNPKWQDGTVTMPPGFKQAYQNFVANGWGGLNGPVDFGGQGLPYALYTALIEDLGTANMGFTLINILTPGAIESLIHHGTPEQQNKWLPKLVSGEWNGTMNLTEPQAGSDVGALKTTATPITEGEHAGKYKIKGTKIFITFGEHDLTDNIVHLVLARTPGAPEGTRGISLFIVPKHHVNDDGSIGAPNDVRCVSIEHKLGIHGSPTCVMSYGDNDDCIGELIGGEFGGIKAMFTMMNNARLNVGNQGIQIAEAATQKAVEYAKERIQSPRAGSGDKNPVAIIEHPDVRRMLLRMKAQTEAARALIYYAAGQVDRAALGLDGAQSRLDVLIPLAKAHATDIGCEVSSIGVQVHGGMGFIEETGAAQFYRDARIAPIYEGTNGIQAADLVGRKMSMDNGAALDNLIADIKKDAGAEQGLAALADAVAHTVQWMRSANVDDKLAGSYPLLTMLSVATCGWLMLQEAGIAKAALGDDPDNAFLQAKLVTTRFYLDRIVPEALGLAAQAVGGAQLLYALDADKLFG